MSACDDNILWSFISQGETETSVARCLIVVLNLTNVKEIQYSHLFICDSTWIGTATVETNPSFEKYYVTFLATLDSDAYWAISFVQATEK